MAQVLLAAGGTGGANPGAGRVEDLSGVGTRGAEFLTIPAYELLQD